MILLLKTYEEMEGPGMEEFAGLQLVNEEPNPVYCELLSGLKTKLLRLSLLRKELTA